MESSCDTIVPFSLQQQHVKVTKMLSFLPGPVRGVLTISLVVLNTLLCILAIYIGASLKLLLPVRAVRRALSRMLTKSAEMWIIVNNGLFRLMHVIDWNITGLDGLHRDRWYLICCNHQSGVDIPVLQNTFHGRIPFIRFFIKQELFWFPLLGLAWWALDYPFVKRYPPEYLEKHPEKRGVDLLTTRRACLRFQEMPTSILSFVEGTRFTPAKHQKQASPYPHLLRPKAGGIALAIASMGRMFSSLLDVTIVYPDGQPGLWGMMCGRLRRVVVHVRERNIPGELLDGDYAADPRFRMRFQEWLHELWREKDRFIDECLLQGGSR